MIVRGVRWGWVGTGLVAAAAVAGWAGRELRITLPGWAAAPLTVLVLAVVWYAWSTRRRYERSLHDRVRLLDEAGEAAVRPQSRPNATGSRASCTTSSATTSA